MWNMLVVTPIFYLRFGKFDPGLEKAGRLEHVVEECEILERRERSRFSIRWFLRMKGTHGLSDPSKRILKRLYLYRDGEAGCLDRPLQSHPRPRTGTVARAQPDLLKRLIIIKSKIQ